MAEHLETSLMVAEVGHLGLNSQIGYVQDLDKEHLVKAFLVEQAEENAYSKTHFGWNDWEDMDHREKTFLAETVEEKVQEALLHMEVDNVYLCCSMHLDIQVDNDHRLKASFVVIAHDGIYRHLNRHLNLIHTYACD